MKKVTAIFMLMLCVLMLAGCETTKPNNTSSIIATTTSVTEVSPATTSIIETSTPETISTLDNAKDNNVQETEETIAVPENSEESPVQLPENPNFRNTVWGMTKDEVKQIEGLSSLALTSDMLDHIVYENDIIAGLPASVVYYFDDNQKLFRGGYNFSEIEHTNKNLYINDYYALVDGLTKVYGSPSNNEPYWSDDLYKDNPDDWGFAASLGDVLFSAEWNTPETRIWIILGGDNYKIDLWIFYDSLTYERVDTSSTAGL